MCAQCQPFLMVAPTGKRSHAAGLLREPTSKPGCVGGAAWCACQRGGATPHKST